jgi:mannose/fructose/N-acetylgalactosamine-specific phosphotransferase system component IID
MASENNREHTASMDKCRIAIGFSMVSDLIRHVVNIKTQVTVLVTQAQSSKQQGCLQHQKLLHKLVMTMSLT